MATITMDVSEYEALNEVRDTLKKSLNRELELSIEIKKLNDEKLKALEDAKMKVLKVTESRVTQHIVTNVSPHEVVERFRRGMNDNRPDWPWDIHYIQGYLFDKVETISPNTHYTEFVGLDQIRDELRKEIESEISDDIQVKLQKYDYYNHQVSELFKEKDGLLKEIDILKFEINRLESSLKKSSDDRESLLKEIEELKNENKTLSELPDVLKDILKDGYGYFNRGELLEKIIKQLNK